MRRGQKILTIRGFRGVNRREGGDNVMNEEFFTTQNYYPLTRGFLHRVPGSTADLTTADAVGASKITGLHRHKNQGEDAFTLYHCEPDTTPLAQPTTDLVLQDIASGGALFGGGAVGNIKVCYTWYGQGQESNYNTRTRAGYTAPGGPRTAAANGYHQNITVGAANNRIRVTVPAFPAGVRGANIFMARTGVTEMTYMGSITTSGGTADFRDFIGPAAAYKDATTPASPAFSVTQGAGTLAPGQYFISMCWLVNGNYYEGLNPRPNQFAQVTYKQAVYVSQPNSAITVTASGTSANGAKVLRVFIGRLDPIDHGGVFVGHVSGSFNLTITEIPKNMNAQTFTQNINDPDTVIAFDGSARLGSNQNTLRTGFILKKDSSGTVSEVFNGRAETQVAVYDGYQDPFTATTPVNYSIRDGYIYTPADNGIALMAHNTPYPPVFTSYYGLTYFANGANIPFKTDGYSMSPMVEKQSTILPPVPRFIIGFKDSLVVGGGQCGSQVYFTKPLSFREWTSATTALQFMTIGDAFGDSVTGVGIFNFTSGTEGPQGYLVATKKNTVWSTYTLTGSSPMEQISGKAGCSAPATMVQTRVGLLFLGSDGVVYAMRGMAEPTPLGQKIQPALAHLVENETAMKLCSATWKDGFYKLAIPSTVALTGADYQWWLDTRTQEGMPMTWSGPHTGVSILAQMVRSSESDDFGRYACLSGSPATVKLDDTSTLQHSGVSVQGVIEWKNSRLGSDLTNKRHEGVLLDAYYDSSFTHSLMGEAFVDDKYAQNVKALSTAGAVWDSSNWDGDQWADALYLPVFLPWGENNLVGRTFRFKLTHTGDAQLILSSMNILYWPEHRLLVGDT